MLLRATVFFCVCAMCLEAVDFLADTDSLDFTMEVSTFGDLILEKTGTLFGDRDA